MHIVPAPAESLMKSRVLSIPGLQGVSAAYRPGLAWISLPAFQTFRERSGTCMHGQAKVQGERLSLGLQQGQLK